MHGIGTFKKFKGEKYYGDFDAESGSHGKGAYTWPDGRKYVGQYAEDMKEGHGTFYWPDGRKYEGGWMQGKQHGEGTYTKANGESKVGIWENGKMQKWISADDN